MTQRSFLVRSIHAKSAEALTVAIFGTLSELPETFPQLGTAEMACLQDDSSS